MSHNDDCAASAALLFAARSMRAAHLVDIATGQGRKRRGGTVEVLESSHTVHVHTGRVGLVWFGLI